MTRAEERRRLAGEIRLCWRKAQEANRAGCWKRLRFETCRRLELIRRWQALGGARGGPIRR